MSHVSTFSPPPSRMAMALFAAKAAVFRLRRAARQFGRDAAAGPHPLGLSLASAPVLAEVQSALWAPLTGNRDAALTLGKIENLRQAARRIHGVEVPAGGVFSFWRQIGRPSRRRGFVKGRELREGCIISSVGGGLCQLSNALYEAALQAGFRVVERHAHSRIVPGSRAALGRDATVFWNYVDLRFVAPFACRVEVELTASTLVVRLRGEGHSAPAAASCATPRDMANDCTTCGRNDCHLNDPDTAAAERLPEAWLVDGCTPELAAAFAARATAKDMLFLPQRLRQRGTAWPAGVAGTERHATLLALRRAFALRRLPAQGGALQSALLRFDQQLAAHFARKVPHTVGTLVIAQRFLPFLWRSGVLGGRSFDVVMERLPLAALQAVLDEAKRRCPTSATLADYRADPALVEAERQALAAARHLLTPHTEIAASVGEKAVLLPWIRPREARQAPSGRTVLLPASPLARKGAFALAEALRGLEGVSLAVTGRASEGVEGLWRGVDVHHVEGPWPDQIAAVVLPALVEHQPRALLKALARGVPVIATPACGLPPQEGLTLVDPYDCMALRAAIRDAVAVANPR